MKTLFLTLVAVVAWWMAGERTAEAGGRFSVGISINYVDDFYAPLSAHGHWVTLRPYGRCWYPAYVAADWRPYADGHWEWTDQGWYWVSDEDWGWATYHYGRWVWDPYYGWVWVPGTEWAPAWVAWREGPDYIGWAPLPPDCDYGPDGFLVIERFRWTPRWFVFVEHRHFCQPVRQHIVVVNQTIINQTVNITKVERHDHETVMRHSGPRIDAVEKHTATRVQEVRAEDLWRQRSERVVERASLSRVKAPPVLTPTVKTTAPAPTVETPAPVTTERPPTTRSRWSQPAVIRGAPTETKTPETVTPPTEPTPGVTMERPVPGRQRWTPPTIIRGTPAETTPPSVTEERADNGRQRWTRPSSNETPAPTEQVERSYPRRSGYDWQGDRDRNEERGRERSHRRDRENSDNTATNSVPYFRGR